MFKPNEERNIKFLLEQYQRQIHYHLPKHYDDVQPCLAVWSEGYAVPICKKGKLDDVNNFRNITMLSTLGKLFTTELNNRLTTWAEEYYICIYSSSSRFQSLYEHA